MTLSLKKCFYVSLHVLLPIFASANFGDFKILAKGLREN